MVDVSSLPSSTRGKREIDLSLYHPSLLSAPPAPQGRSQLSYSLSFGAQGTSESTTSRASQNSLLSPGTGRGVQSAWGLALNLPKVSRGLRKVQGQLQADWMLSQIEILTRAPPFLPCTRNPLEIVL